MKARKPISELNRSRTETLTVGQEEGARALSLDSAAVLERVGGDRALLAELVELFLKDCPAQLGELRKAIATEDSSFLEQVSHRLKGALLNLGAAWASELAGRLENMGRSQVRTGGTAECAALEREIAHAQREWSVLCHEARE